MPFSRDLPRFLEKRQMENPAQIWKSWLVLSSQAAWLTGEAQTVVALRLMRLAQGGAFTQTEAQRMVAEKGAAMTEAQVAAAAIMGGGGHRVARKVLGVYRKRVRGNRRRLTK
jgi:hypothetical protein